MVEAYINLTNSTMHHMERGTERFDKTSNLYTLSKMRFSTDLPTPVKYFNPAIKDEYKKIEKIAEQKLIDMAPDAFKQDYAELIDSHYHSEDEAFIVKAADVLCAYLKTLEELSAGNREFTLAKKRLDKMLKDYHSEEVDYFLTRYVPSFSLSLDEITQDDSDEKNGE